MPVPNVDPNSVATSSWANDVADSVNAIEGDIYPGGGQLAIPWNSVTGKPSTFTPAAHSLASHSGDVRDIGGFQRQAAGGTVGTRIYVGTSTPSSPSEGDIWIKG